MKENLENSFKAGEVIKSNNSDEIKNSWEKHKTKRVEMIKSHKEIEKNEFLTSKREIDKELEFLGVNENNNRNSNIERKSVLEDKLSKAQEVKEYFKQLVGDSSISILIKLISKYKDDESLSAWVKNWKNFFSLYQFAQNKPPAEQKAIETIISNSNFTEENSFDLALSEINKSNEISTETKLDIQRQFNATGINTVHAFDYTLKQEKKL